MSKFNGFEPKIEQNALYNAPRRRRRGACRQPDPPSRGGPLRYRRTVGGGGAARGCAGARAGPGGAVPGRAGPPWGRQVAESRPEPLSGTFGGEEDLGWM